jgi:hypothetical protein
MLSYLCRLSSAPPSSLLAALPSLPATSPCHRWIGIHRKSDPLFEVLNPVKQCPQSDPPKTLGPERTLFHDGNLPSNVTPVHPVLHRCVFAAFKLLPNVADKSCCLLSHTGNLVSPHPGLGRFRNDSAHEDFLLCEPRRHFAG